MYASGLSEYHHGVPDKQKKCCGKKVIFISTITIMKWIFALVELRILPENSGNKYTKLPKMANMALSEST